MKNPGEAHYQSPYDAAARLRQQFAEREWQKGVPLPRSRKNPLLVPFLLSIPVVIFVVILGLSWSRQSMASHTTGQQYLAERTPIPVERPAHVPPTGRTVIASHPSATIIPREDTVVKARKFSRPGTLTTAIRFEGQPGLQQLVRLQPAYEVKKGLIRNMELQLTNLSAAVLDLVVIEVAYQGPQGQELKTENLYIKDIAAGGTARVAVPEPGTARRLSYKVSLLSAKEANLYLVSR